MHIDRCISIFFDFTRLLLCTRNAYRSSLTSLDFCYVQQMHIDRPSLTSLDFLLCTRNAYRSSLTSLDFYYVQEMHIDQSSLTSLYFYYVQEMHIDRLDFTRLLLCTKKCNIDRH